MRFYQTLPCLWLLTDARNDAALGHILRRLPRGSGLIFRHYHLDETARRRRFCEIAQIARRFGHCVILSGNAAKARHWGADGIYAPPAQLGRARGLIRIATAHDFRELGAANQAQADAVLLSPVFATNSHPGGAVLGPVRFRLLAACASMPALALGGMNIHAARRLDWPYWAAIDGFIRIS